MSRIVLAVALAAGALCTAAAAEPFVPSADEAVRLVRAHRTNGSVTVGATLAYAERQRPESFRLAGIQAERRPGEGFARVRLCYWLSPPGRRAPPSCGIGFVVTTNPPHVEPVQRFEGLGRDLQDGREAFLRGLDRESALRADPDAVAVRALLDPFEIYDNR